MRRIRFDKRLARQMENNNEVIKMKRTKRINDEIAERICIENYAKFHMAVDKAYYVFKSFGWNYGENKPYITRKEIENVIKSLVADRVKDLQDINKPRYQTIETGRILVTVSKESATDEYDLEIYLNLT